MVRILGNSPERVPIDDLNDIIYYKQLKDYTDQEYESSKDLKRAINRGHLAILEQNKSPRGSVETDGNMVNNQAPALNARDLKIALREIIPEIQNKSVVSEDAMKGAVREIAPLIVSMVREEVSKMALLPGMAPIKKKTEFLGPEYLPDINTEGLVDNINAEKRKTSSENVEDSLAVLRNLKGKQS